MQEATLGGNPWTPRRRTRQSQPELEQRSQRSAVQEATLGGNPWTPRRRDRQPQPELEQRSQRSAMQEATLGGNPWTPRRRARQPQPERGQRKQQQQHLQRRPVGFEGGTLADCHRSAADPEAAVDHQARDAQRAARRSRQPDDRRTPRTGSKAEVRCSSSPAPRRARSHHHALRAPSPRQQPRKPQARKKSASAMETSGPARAPDAARERSTRSPRQVGPSPRTGAEDARDASPRGRVRRAGESSASSPCSSEARHAAAEGAAARAADEKKRKPRVARDPPCRRPASSDCPH